MFKSAHPWREYLLHWFLAIAVTPILGIADYRLTPVAGALIAWLATRKQATRAAASAWLPAFALFALAAWEPLRSWNPSWSDMGRWEYLTNTMFGPNCNGSECLYTIFTAILTGGIGYSLAGYLVWRRNSSRSVSE